MVAQQLINAIALGSIYALIALGYTMVYGIVRLINFAHGDVLMLGAFFGLFTMSAMSLSPFVLVLALIIAMVCAGLFNIVIEKVAYKPLRQAPRINILITAIGMSFFLENGARLIPTNFIESAPWLGFGSEYHQYPTLPDLTKAIQLGEGGASVSLMQITVLIIAVILMLLLSYTVKFTKIGKAMRAVSHDMNAALLMGINVNQVISFTFAIGGSLAAAAGILYASMFPSINTYIGIMPGLKAFVAAVLGGIGSVPGAMIGGFIIALAETFTKGYINTKLADAIVFGIMILVLVIKPSGIMGKNTIEKV